MSDDLPTFERPTKATSTGDSGNVDILDAEVTKAEAEKVATMRKEVAEGKRSALPQGYEFVPAAMDSRGRLGPKLTKLLEWLAEAP
jgi:hypothetical protein